MTTMIDSYGHIYLCGGKVSLSGKSNKCIRIEAYKSSSSYISYIIDETYSGGSGIKSSGPFPGLYLKANSFISESQNEGGIYNDRMCMLSISDGTNKPKCYCCDIDDLNKNNGNGNPSSIYCDDLQNSIGCPSRFDACVIHDKYTNILYQIGGYYGYTIYDTILCFDLETETFLNDNDERCNYGNLIKPMYGLGCTVLPNGGQIGNSTIITVGGLDTLSTSSSTSYSQSIDICKSDNSNCKQLSISLNDGIYKTRVFPIDDCNIGIVGGTIKLNGYQVISDKIDIANICTMEWISNGQLNLPLPLTEMGIIQTNGIFCLYGGISFNITTYLPQLSQSAYCTDLGVTLSPTTTNSPTSNPIPSPTKSPTNQPTFKPTLTPTNIPTSSPTFKPTAIPTITESGDIIITDPTFTNEFVQFNQGMSGQTCFSDSQYLYVCGGYSDIITSYNLCYVYNENGDKRSLPIYLTNNNNNIDDESLLLPMPNFYCKNQCSVMYKNQLFLVNPTIETDSSSSSSSFSSNNIQFYKCSIDLYSNNGYVLCIDLCENNNNNNLEFCDELIKFESCITSQGQYLYISGGYDINGEISSDISIFDMDPLILDWVSVPKGSFATFFGYQTFIGQLSVKIASHSCSFWNSSLYIIGGKDLSVFPQSTIQICPNSNEIMDKITKPNEIKSCYISEIELNDARYNARSAVIGSSIVTVCGTKSTDEFTEKIEIYDAFFDQFKSISTLENGARTACCFMDWTSKSKLVISGGEEWNGLTSQTIDDMIFSEYTTKPIISKNIDENTILDCKNIDIDTRDYSFKSQYDIYNQINDYYIFATQDRKSYLIIDASGKQKTWIYNYTEKTSCYYENDNGQIVDIGPGLWTKPRTRYSQTQRILITIQCIDTLTSNNNNNNEYTLILWGMTEAAFITCIVVIALIIITILMVGFCCWWKKTSTIKDKYDIKITENKQKHKKNRNKNKKKNKKKRKSTKKRIKTPQNEDYDSTDDDEDEDEEEEEESIDDSRENSDDEHNNGQHHSFKVNEKHHKGTLGIFNINKNKKKNNEQYIAAKSYSKINSSKDLTKTITIVRHSQSINDNENDKDNDLSMASIELQQNQQHHCNITRYHDDDDDDDSSINSSSSCTVNPHEVKFEVEDKNTDLIDQIALEIKRQQKYDFLNKNNKNINNDNDMTNHRKTQSIEIAPKYKRQEPEKPAQSINTIYMKPSELNLAASSLHDDNNTSSMQYIQQPVMLNCPPPPPPPHVTMNNNNNDDHDNNTININNKDEQQLLISTHNGSYSEDQSTVIFGLNDNRNIIYDELTDISNPMNHNSHNNHFNNFDIHHTRMSAMSVSKDNYAGHVNDHISQHDIEDRL